MKEGYTHISVVLDSSGSMATILEDTIGGFNTFLKGQKETAKEGDTFTFVKFSSGTPPYQFHYKNADIKKVHKLTNKTFIPSGGTALLDTLGATIKDLGSHLASLPEEERPAKVIFVIITDGEENSSHLYNKTQIKNLITEHTNTWKWEFVFLGANQDAIQEAHQYGISTLNSMSYGANEIGIKSTYDSLTRSLNTYKSAAVGATYASSGAAFTNAERTASMGSEVANNTTSLTGTFVFPTTPIVETKDGTETI
jgi:hypothetical protein